MDSAKRQWEGRWSGDPFLLLDAAERTVGAVERPIAVALIQLDWESQQSKPPTVKAAREKLHMSPWPEWVEVIFAPVDPDNGEPATRLGDLGGFYLAIRGSSKTVRVSGSGTDVTALVEAFEAARNAIEQPMPAAEEEPPPPAAEEEPPPILAPTISPPPAEKPSTPWFHNPAIIVPIAVAVIGAIAVIVAATHPGVTPQSLRRTAVART